MLCATILFCQYNHLKFEKFSTEDGLASSTCVEIFQDADGFLWLGTIDGLNKYDGYNFTTYRPLLNSPHSISNNRIHSIIEDNSGHLWVGTSNGLNMFDKKLERFYRISLQDEVQSDDQYEEVINDLHFDHSRNSLWVATKNGVFRSTLVGSDDENYLQPTFDHFTSDNSNERSIDNNDVTNIISDKLGQIWLLTSGDHLNQYNEASKDFDKVLIDAATINKLGQLPKSIMVDTDNNFWIGNNLSSLTIWNQKDNSFRQTNLVKEHIPIFDIYEDSNGVIWIATDGFGLYLLNKEGEIIQHVENNPQNPFSLPNNQPSKILEDKDGIFWLASYNKGVSKLALSTSLFNHHFYDPDGISSNSSAIAQSVMEDRNGNIWLGTDGNGLALFDKENSTYKAYHAKVNNTNSLSSDKILYLLDGKDGHIWICTWDGGLTRFNPETKTFTQYKNDASNPYSIGQNTVWHGVEDDENRLWLGTQTAGLNLFDPKTERFYKYLHVAGQAGSLISDFVFSLFIDSQNRLLVGTALGLNIIDLDQLSTYIPENLSFELLQEAKIHGNRINYITEDKHGNIWLGTDLGLHKLDSELQLLKTYTTANGLPNNLIVGIVEDHNGHLWITTKRGISKLNPATDSFKNFNTSDGVQGLEFQSKSIAKTSDGKILAGGINGFNYFDPDDIEQDLPSLKPIITDLKLYNESVKPEALFNKHQILEQSISQTESISLRHDENYITFDFLALNLLNPSRVQYAYRMLGLDDEFINVGSNRSANYPSLPPGRYTFEVSASLDGNWEKAEATSVQVHVLSPPWLSWWAYLLYALLISGLIWFGLRYYTKIVREEKERELDQMKLEFFINISHEFRTPLTLILNPVEKILTSYNNPQIVKSSSEVIHKSVRRLLSLVNQLLDFRKMDLGKTTLEVIEGDIVKFCNETFMQFEGLMIKKGLDFSFQANKNSIVSHFDPDKLEKIIYNLVSNAIKYTEPGGKVDLEVDLIKSDEKKSFFSLKKDLEDVVEIRVKDTGIGFKKMQLKNVFNRFFHVDKNIAGTGIGLNFTKSLVELHGGEIAVESVYNQGSSFIVKLPINIRIKDHVTKLNEREVLENYAFGRNAVTSAEYEFSIQNNQDHENKEPTDQNEKTLSNEALPTLLIVEDNQELRTHLKIELSNFYKVREASNGVKGYELAVKHFPDIIISDVMMPKMDGFELCSKIKDNLETCNIPVILLTARILDEDKIKGFNTGADEYLPKPFSMYVLRARIKNLLEQKKRLREKFAALGGIVPASELTSNSSDQAFLDKSTQFVIDNINEDFGLDELINHLGTSRSQLYRKINTLTGNNPSHFIRTIRLKYASQLLLRQQYSIKEVAYMTGFNSRAYFSKTFRELFDKTPKQFIEEHNSEEVVEDAAL
ncbi:hybrid sensor histidine kinase/response regulator [Portibacter lacus]|uniref:histidine kinase n=2 Tax=Portibacter lacus TaxID=1099794 RepID=A0AA37WF52_9BACT|nr:hybrid sensor histidine kinase/response regulator [Portibacter lacus]